MRFHGVKHRMPQWPRLRCSVKDKSTNPLAFVYFLKCHHLPRPFANTQTGTCSRMGGANFVNTCIISPVLQPCSPVLQGSLQPPDFDGELFIHSFVWAVVGVVVFVLHYCNHCNVFLLFSPLCIWMCSWMCLRLLMVSPVLLQFLGCESQLWLRQKTEEG